MTSPSRTYLRNQDQDHGLDLGLEDSNSRDVYSGNGSNSDDGNDDANRTKPNRNPNPLQAKRSGPLLPPRGQIPLESNGFESVDAFWNAARSPPAGTNDNEYSSRGRGEGQLRKERERQRLLEERRKRREELEREARDNAARGPEILNRNDGDDDDDEDEDAPRSATRQTHLRQQQQRTPNPPGWTNRLLHKAMGIPTGHQDDDDRDDDRGSVPSPAYTVLSRVSTAPPSVAASIATHATEASARHALRQRQEQLQLDNLVHERAGTSPSARSVPASPSVNEQNMGRSPHSPSSSHDSREKGMDPPEEMETSSNNSRNRGGVAPDPVEKDLVLEPPEQDGEQEETEEVDFTSTGNGGHEIHDDDMEINSRASSKVSGKSGTESRGKLSERTTPSRELDESLEQVVDSFDKVYDRGNRIGVDDDDDDDDKESGGGMQLATQEGMDDDPQFDARGGGYDYDNDMDANTNYREDKSEADSRSRQSSKMSKSSNAVQSTYSSVQEKEKTPPKKKKSNTESAPVTPSALRKKGSKKKNANQRVNWSTPTGRATGIPAANRDYEAVPVSDYKEDYPPGKEPQTPGGTQLRRSKRARFKPLQFWKNEKLIYEAQHEEGLLGEAMGDMPVVAGVMHALPTPYKERKARDRPEKAAKKDKKRRRTSDDDDSDGGQPASKVPPFDDSKLRKRYHIHDGESGSIWSEPTADVTESKVVSRMENRSFSKLPLSSTRKKTESKVVGFASQAFHILTDENDHFPGYIAGNVVLPPRGIKDAEGVGLCSQVFNVGECQPNSLELALADPSTNDGEFDHATAQRYLLSKGDMFHVPPGNVYRIENHSKTEKASLFWTIVKCTNRAEQDSDED